MSDWKEAEGYKEYDHGDPPVIMGATEMQSNGHRIVLRQGNVMEIGATAPGLDGGRTHPTLSVFNEEDGLGYTYVISDIRQVILDLVKVAQEIAKRNREAAT